MNIAAPNAAPSLKKWVPSARPASLSPVPNARAKGNGVFHVALSAWAVAIAGMTWAEPVSPAAEVVGVAVAAGVPALPAGTKPGKPRLCDGEMFHTC